MACWGYTHFTCTFQAGYDAEETCRIFRVFGFEADREDRVGLCRSTGFIPIQRGASCRIPDSKILLPYRPQIPLNQTEPTMLDVIVIGAGFSGLQAAYSAKQAGLSVAVVEARDRVGGKIWSVPLASGRGFAELGGAWINDSLQPRVWSYVQRFGLQIVKQRLEGTAVMQESENERFEFPFGVTPDVSIVSINCYLDLFRLSRLTWSMFFSLHQKRRRTWSSFAIISRPNH